MDNDEVEQLQGPLYPKFHVYFRHIILHVINSWEYLDDLQGAMAWRREKVSRFS